jgi:hypothetical protein
LVRDSDGSRRNKEAILFFVFLKEEIEQIRVIHENECLCSPEPRREWLKTSLKNHVVQKRKTSSGVGVDEGMDPQETLS